MSSRPPMPHWNPPRLQTFAVAAATALLLILAMPGRTGWWPLLFVALVPLLATAVRLSPLRSACMGMFCGLLYNIGLLYWIVIVLGRYGGLPPWISVPGMALLALYMAGYLALFCFFFSLAFHAVPGQQKNFILVWGAPLLWVSLEYLRSIIFSGFPWMDIGYGLYSRPLLIQAADLGGHYLISFAVVAINALLARLLVRPLSFGCNRARFFPLSVTAALVLLLCIGGYSQVRLGDDFSSEHGEKTAVVTVVQGNISQDEKWTVAREEDTLRTYIDLTRAAVNGKGIDLVVWPETALPFYPQRNPLTARVIGLLKQEGTPLLTGAPFYVRNREPNPGGNKVDYYNSGLLIGADGRLAGRYDKQHLVPFGEYVPLRKYLPFLEPLVVSVGDFTAGTSYRPLVLGRIRAGVLICFESIFPEIARREVISGANLLVNLTNDAWYGRSSAPYQSLAMAVFRAVENRRSLVRAANTGISGFINPSGEIALQSQLFEPAALSRKTVLQEQQTFYTRWGHWFGMLCLVLSVPLVILSWQRYVKGV